MDYKKMTETRQSCRAFDPVRTPDRAVLTQVLEAARLAPSACTLGTKNCGCTEAKKDKKSCS